MYFRVCLETLTREARFGAISLITSPSGPTTALPTRGSHRVPPLEIAA
jgi:hypothetical protein